MQSSLFPLWILLIFANISQPTHAYYLNGRTATEDWLINDAYNRSMSHNLKILQDSENRRKQGKVTENIEDGEEDDDEIFGPDMLNIETTFMTREGIFMDSSGIYRLAEMYDKNLRKISFSHFTKLIATFDKNVKQLYNVPSENIATGLTALLAGGYAAYNNKSFPIEAIRPTVEDIRDALHEGATFLDVKGNEKLWLYQRIIGFGLQLQLTQAEMAKNPDPIVISKMRRVGENILRDILSVDPARVDFTDEGIVFR